MRHGSVTTEHLPVDSHAGEDDDQPVHIFCPHAQLTWCGDDANKHVPVIPKGTLSADQVCRVCMLAVEMLDLSSGACPVCKCRSCIAG